jgi:hypothetical protein
VRFAHSLCPPVIFTLVFMSLPETVVLDVPNLLTLAGVVVAVLAAVYSGISARASQRQATAAETALKQAAEQSQLARAALSEAKRQNRIAAHGHQLDAFKALLSFYSQLTSQGVDFKPEAVWELWEHARIAEFYFSVPLAQELGAIVDAAIALQQSRDEWKMDSAFPASQRSDAVEKTYAQLKQLRRDVESAEQVMRKELRLVDDED